ncbi:MAG TPA: ABC transporter permease [Thermoclostridium caenicola]|uniref:ABC transporter permease n=1 Tax=Thermoclostridium caenicola TaxID=659425 RepID=UPI002CB2952F|nr:ABC transporter permease [Thermoclostridium caenicola]HOK42494.1 ABC transporter permease [Thermoclostridium caenicola]HOL84479.1 ABC transporter permease [Thermoclostridium caenicola]HPO76671.1 ABC transporter permease [Thermoclostridium caenicola]
MSIQTSLEHVEQKKEKGFIRNLLNRMDINAVLPLVGFIVIVVVFAFLTDMRIVQPNSINLILSQVYVLMIAASGVFMVMTIGGLDFSQGSILGLSSIIISYLSFYNIILAIIAGVVAGAAIGAINGFFHVKFRIPSFIVTICTMFLFRGLNAYLTTNSPVAAHVSVTSYNVTWLKMLLTILVLLILYLVFKYTKLGMVLKAIGAGETAARFSGVRTNLTKFLVFTAAGAITGFAAFLNVIKVGSITATAGNQLETQILISLVLGGMPITGGAKVRFYNIVVGTLIFCILNNGLVMLALDTAVQQLIKGIIFVLVVALTIDRKSIQVVK